MDNRNCDIVKDLIPSYAEGICSQATREYVEEHLESCDKCRQVMEACKANVLTGEAFEQRGLDGLKKIRKKMKYQTIVCYLVLVFLVYCGIEVFLANHVGYAIFNNTTLLLVICILANLFASLGYHGKNSPGKIQYILGGISLLLDVFFLLVFVYAASGIASGAEKLFGRELMRVGPFLERQLIAAFIAQLVFFGYNLWAIIKQDKNCGWLLNLNMTGIFLMINYDMWLKLMASRETLLRAILKISFEPLAAGILGIAASLILARVLRKKEAGLMAGGQ